MLFSIFFETTYIKSCLIYSTLCGHIFHQNSKYKYDNGVTLQYFSTEYITLGYAENCQFTNKKGIEKNKLLIKAVEQKNIFGHFHCTKTF